MISIKNVYLIIILQTVLTIVITSYSDINGYIKNLDYFKDKYTVEYLPEIDAYYPKFNGLYIEKINKAFKLKRSILDADNYTSEEEAIKILKLYKETKDTITLEKRIEI